MEQPIEQWSRSLREAVAQGTLLRAVQVVEEIGSTQDLARSMRDRPGLVVVARRQTAGRGRLGRSWEDTGFDGAAMTLVLADDREAPPERLVMVSAVAAARAVERIAPIAVGIKWPNDLMVRGRKLGGILIERVAGAALVGIGINVRQRSFSSSIARSATSLLLEVQPDHEDRCDRLALIVALIAAFDEALHTTDQDLATEYARRDALQGCRGSFGTPAGEVDGVVIRVEPSRGLLVRTDAGECWLAAATTTVLSWKEARSFSR